MIETRFVFWARLYVFFVAGTHVACLWDVSSLRDFVAGLSPCVIVLENDAFGNAVMLVGQQMGHGNMADILRKNPTSSL